MFARVELDLASTREAVLIPRDGLVYRGQQPGVWNLASEWVVAPGSSNTLGFTNLDATLVNLKVDTKRR